jgi:hypothetical protein
LFNPAGNLTPIAPSILLHLSIFALLNFLLPSVPVSRSPIFS